MARRVVVGNGDDGRSAVVADGRPDLVLHAPPGAAVQVLTGGWPSQALSEGEAVVHEMWSETAVPSGRADVFPRPEDAGFEVAEGATKWILTEFGPHVEAPIHQTATVDYGTVISGEVTLVLDTGDVDLAAGDAVVIAGVRHGWRAGPVGATVSTVLVGLPPSGTHRTADLPEIRRGAAD
ncbi:hypothetical protein [Mycolicibacterium sp. XJ1819]